MNTIKKKSYNDGYEIEVINDKNEIINIGFAGSDLYWTCLNYTDENEFIITTKDGRFYNDLKKLFSIIKKYYKLINENIFEWNSEAYGEPEFANKLIIEKEDEIFKIKFIQNRLNIFSVKRMCPICFCLSGSRNQKIACEFSLMFLKYRNIEKDISLSRKMPH